MLPTTKDAANDLANDPDLGPFIKLLPHTRFYPLEPKWEPMVLEVIKAWQVAILGQKDPKEALDDVAAKVNKEILGK
jgi:multiple sugar transport system substrate-binding protein